MNNITKLSLIAAGFAALTGSASFADDTHLRNQIDIQRQVSGRDQSAATVAVYAEGRGVGQRIASQSESSDLRFQLRTPAQGQRFGIFVPAQ